MTLPSVMLEQLRSSTSKAPKGLPWRSSTIFIIVTVGVGIFTDLCLYALLVPVLPFMLKDRVGLPDDQIQSTISALLSIFAAASVVASPVAGILADKMSKSRKLPFLLGLVMLFAATILLAVGQTVPMLAIARLLQGASGGVVWTIGLAVLIETVGSQNLGTAMGTIFSFVSVGGLLAPTIGGLLYSKTGYRGVFGVGIGLVTVDFILRLLMVEKKVATTYNKISTQGQSIIIQDDTEETPLLLNMARTQSQYSLSKPENRIPKALPILLLLRDPALLTAIWIGFMQSLLLGAFDATVPLEASKQFGFDSLKAGLLFLPLGGADFFLGPIFGWCVDNYGTKLLSVFGFTWLVPTLVLLRLSVTQSITSRLDKSRHIALYAGLLAANGVGLAAINAPSVVEAGDVVEKYSKANPEIFKQPPYAQLYGLTSMVYSIGLTIGPLLAGLLRERIGYGNMNLVLAGFCALTAALSALFIGRKEEDSTQGN